MTEDDIAAFAGDFCRFAFPEGCGVVWFHCPNESPRSPAYGAKLKRHGLRAGVLDYVFMTTGRDYWIELKSLNGTLSGSQIDFDAEVRGIGHRTEVARSPEEFVATLHRFGLAQHLELRGGQIVTKEGQVLHTGQNTYRRPRVKRPGKRAIKRAMDFFAP